MPVGPGGCALMGSLALCRENPPFTNKTQPHEREALQDPFQGSCSTNLPWLGASLEIQFHIDGISLMRAQWGQRKDIPKPSSLWIMSQEWNAPTQAPPLLLPHCPSRLLTLTTVALSETKKTPFAFACWMMQTHLLTFLDEHFSSVNGPAMISLPCQWGGSGESLFNVPSKGSFYAVWHQGKTQAGFPTALQSSWEGSPKPLPPFQGPSLRASYLMAWADIQL